MLVLGRVSVGVHDEVTCAVVRGLECSAGVDVDQPSRGNVLAFRRVADIHRERAGEDDEGLLLHRMSVTAARGSRLIPPNVPAHVRESGELAQLGDVSRRRARLMRPRDPLELVWPNDTESHPATLRADRYTIVVTNPGRRSARYDPLNQAWSSQARGRSRLAVPTPGGSMRFLLTSAGIKNTSIGDALVGLLGKPIAESSALCIPTAAYGHP